MTRDDLESLAGWYLGYGRDSSAWDGEQRAVIRDVVQMAIRRIHVTEEVPELGIPAAYPWSFLRPVATMSFDAMESSQALPADFGGLDGVVTASNGDGSRVWRLSHVSLASARSQRDVPGIPSGVVIDWGRSANDRARLVLVPTPSEPITVRFQYYLTPAALGPDAKPYGADVHEELYRAAVKACAELEVDGQLGEQNSYFLQRLVASIRADQRSVERRLGVEFVDPRHAVLVRFNGELH